MDINKTIKRNLFFKVDFDGKYKKTKKGIKQDVRFFLIGSVPVVIEYKEGKKERAVIYCPVEVKPDDKEPKKIASLRLMHGAKYEYLPTIKKAIKERFNVDLDFKKEADEVVKKSQKAIRQIIDEGKFKEKEIDSIMIINIGKKEYEQSKNNKA